MANEREVKLGLARNVNKGGNMFSHYIGKLYFPSVNQDGQLVNHRIRQHHLDIVCETLSREYGGCTTYDGDGYYKDDDGVLVVEPVTVVEVIAEENPTEVLRNIADYVKKTLKQECVLFTVQPLYSKFV